ncbi:hypothetical protein AB0F72_08980 [Actinoplanes sp. NPDC023936]|uniref:hypothetical protein n=1 Tax=Actinoplanes sp. NPDC023936 TaxID=3154910 RepID=UPI0033E9CF7C
MQTNNDDSGGDVTIGPHPLPEGTLLYPCLTCGVAVIDKGRGFHSEWHASLADVVIETTRRVESLEAR